MPDHIYKSVEITGSSNVGVDDAIARAVARAGESLHGLRRFEVTNIRGQIESDNVAHWQVTMKIGFTLDDNPASA
jgi:flavin-binding protein dodecin